MQNVYFSKPADNEQLRRRIYAGDLFVLPPTGNSLALCKLADDMLREAFDPLDPELAQFKMPVEQYAQILGELKPRFIHHPECKQLIPGLLEEIGCDVAETYFDVPRLRTSTAQNYLTSGIAYAFHPHRDTWYSAAQCQINWWMPVRPITSDNCMAFFPRYFEEGLKNSSRVYNYYKWNKESRANAAKQIGEDKREQPKPEQELQLNPDLRLVPPVGGIIVFSGAQLHASVQNTSDRTRLSIDFRTVDRRDVANRAGAANVDSECTGTSLRDFLRCTDLERLPSELIAPYDTEVPEEDAVMVYEPGKVS